MKTTIKEIFQEEGYSIPNYQRDRLEGQEFYGSVGRSRRSDRMQQKGL
ncbi:hypothetical protein [Helicobacter pylori]|nr:hypothetical protein [Helicobacter pylori]